MKTERVISLLLAALVLLTAFVACGKNNIADNSGGFSDATPEDLDADGVYEKLVKNANYNGSTFLICCGGNLANNDFIYDTESDNNLYEAEFRRKSKLEEDLGIKIETVERLYWAQCFGGGPFHQDIYGDVMSGNKSYDLIYGCIYEDATLTEEGCLYSLSSLPNVSIERDWYDQDARKSLSISGDVYFINGDYSVFDDEYTHCILFNKQLCTDNGIDPAVFYGAVDKGSWTVDVLGAYCRNFYQDENGNGIADYGDRFGLLTWNDSVCAMFTACGARIATLNSDGEAELTMKTSTAVNMLSKYLDYAFNDYVSINCQTVPGNDDGVSVRDNIFTSDLALFAQVMITYARNYGAYMFSDFGILPYPKYDEKQSQYYTYSTLSVMNAVAVPLLINDYGMTGTFLEAASILGQTLVRPEYYNIALQRRMSRDDESQAMLDIIFSTRVYDVGYFYNIGSMYSNLLAMFSQKSNTFNVLYAAYKTKMNSQLESINEKLAELHNSLN